MYCGLIQHVCLHREFIWHVCLYCRYIEHSRRYCGVIQYVCLYYRFIHPACFQPHTNCMTNWHNMSFLLWAHTHVHRIIFSDITSICTQIHIRCLIIAKSSNLFACQANTTCVCVLCTHLICYLVLWTHMTCSLFCRYIQYVCFYCRLTQRVCLYWKLI